jgi:hypothetical protein
MRNTGLAAAFALMSFATTTHGRIPELEQPLAFSKTSLKVGEAWLQPLVHW